MDWIRLTKSGKDLTGLKGRLIEVTEEELKKHNEKDDCWICIRGRWDLLCTTECLGGLSTIIMLYTSWPCYLVI